MSYYLLIAAGLIAAGVSLWVLWDIFSGTDDQ